ncbi:SRPBCC family protein [Mesorhizobium sp.]|uniref:SRPBCC family protein n=1 Tax=Mesorhizobium sp. TaxID=1871066 RepID=UPI000FE2FA97|nr:SRPBCC family protein [Mesorhizobium sp.]RWH72923.1 MAG: SRPBCC family protein [Mesorhizobium sp.]RWL34191.1 MAG: SRPBCC family protein [Mesorhizobium sp.]RWL35607.1 MAG: SRPBCC family protein [Mesorhizobium sp.]RWL41017.1 MAG: SRPBCC family protein [Mesorhizobium sp.]RWL52217.1 MAG: SRPBCC family protein [Mesorhizobium sp.]
MSSAYESTVIDADPDTVWGFLRDFDGTGKYVVESLSSEIEDGKRADQVGAVRRILLEGGFNVRERLVHMSDLDRSFSYALLPGGDVPLENYVATMRVTPVTDSGKSFVEWSSTFTASGDDPVGLVKWLHEIYRSGLNGLRKAAAGREG